MKKKRFFVISLILYGITKIRLLHIFKRYDKRSKPVVLDIDHEEISFMSKSNRLFGNIFGENKNGLIVLSHGLGLGSDDYYGITKALVSFGYQVVAFDNTGSFRSQGKSSVGMNQSLIDLKSALDYILDRKDLDTTRLYLVGHSWGGYAVASILNDRKYPIDKIVSMAGSNQSFELIWKKSKFYEKILFPFIALNYVITFGKYAFYSSVNGLNRSSAKALIVHGSKDEMVELDTLSIYAHRHDIKNPYVEYFIRHEKNHNNHNSIFQDKNNPKVIDTTLLQKMITFFEDTKDEETLKNV